MTVRSDPAADDDAPDATSEERDRRYRETQRGVLLDIAAGHAVEETLTRLAHALEERLPTAMVSVLLLDEERRLRHGAAPSLPESYVRAIDGMLVVREGSCGTAIQERRTVVVEDIATDPLWANHRQLALSCDLAACWAVPCLDVNGRVLGSFAVYFCDPRAPRGGELELLEDVAPLAGVAVSRARDTARLTESEERFRLLARATSDALWDWNMVTDHVWWSSGLERLFGYSPDEVRDAPKWWKSKVHPDDRGWVVASLKAAVRSGSESWSVEYRFRRQDGTYAVVASRATLVGSSHGRATRLVGGLTDVTDRRRLEEQYVRGRRLESLGAIAGGIAHDLNNVLTPVLISTDLLGVTDLDDQQRRTVEVIADCARRGSQLVNQVVAFARGTQGDRTQLDPGILVGEVERILRSSTPERVDVRCDVDPDAPLVLGDAAQLQQILLDLASNACDAMPGGGVLSVTARAVELDAVSASMLGSLEAGDHALFSVTDTGTGMSRAMQAQAFEPHVSTKSASGGSGLGLPRVRSIVESHHGAIHLDSDRGRGTTVKVFLPAAREEHPTPVSAADDSFPRGAGESVLVVDDEAAVRAVAREVLESHGYRVTVARDGDEAVALYASLENTIDVVVTDVTMPVFDGIATTQALRRIDPRARVVVATGLAVDGSAARAREAGAIGVLVKPFTTQLLLQAVHRALHDTAEPGASPPAKHDLDSVRAPGARE